MSRIIHTCSECGRLAQEQSRTPILFSNKYEHVNLVCGHSYQAEKTQEFSCPGFEFHDKTVLYPFQKENVNLLYKAGFRGACFDEMGLGKTITALSILRLADLGHIDPTTIYPVAIFVKAGLKYQWLKEVWTKLGKHSLLCDATPDETLFKLLPIHIYSQDSLRNHETREELRYKTIILDECQQIKNPESKRTKAILDVVKNTPNLVALSGTPIKNHAGEFFPILNALRPEKFPSYNQFLRYWTRSYFGSGKSVKLGGLSDPKRFGEYTSDFLIRHERKDVLPDLPAIQRNFIVNVLADNLENSYSDELREFINKYEESKEGSEVQNVLAIMARMRHIVGLSKTSDAVEWTSDFLESHNGDKTKLTLFHHHEDVGKILFVGLNRLCRELEIPGPIWLSEPGISDETRMSRVNEFVTGDKQLLIASTIKSGEGLNLQVCSHALITERQWNPGNEEQAEGSFSRIGSTADKISVSYLVCAGSIDEMFSEIVERKRQYIGESNAALTGKDISIVTKFDETSVMKELAEKLFSAGKKKFSLPVSKVG